MKVTILIFVASFLWPVTIYGQMYNGCNPQTYNMLLQQYPRWQVDQMCARPIQGAPQNQPISSRCGTQIGACPMPYPAPFGTSCYCGTSSGPVPCMIVP